MWKLRKRLNGYTIFRFYRVNANINPKFTINRVTRLIAYFTVQPKLRVQYRVYHKCSRPLNYVQIIRHFAIISTQLYYTTLICNSGNELVFDIMCYRCRTNLPLVANDKPNLNPIIGYFSLWTRTFEFSDNFQIKIFVLSGKIPKPRFNIVVYVFTCLSIQDARNFLIVEISYRFIQTRKIE